MMDEPRATPHERFEALAELALGILDGPQRASLLGHIASCASCAVELEQWTAAAVELAPHRARVDPPVGFETRLLERMSRSWLAEIWKR